MAVCQSGGVRAHAAITTLTLRLSPRAGRYSNVATVARHARASYAVACQAWRIEPIPRSETSLKIMSGYFVCRADEFNAMYAMISEKLI